MSKKIEEVMTPEQLVWHKRYHLNPDKDYWDCHGKPVPTHPAMQKVAEIDGIKTGKYEIIECDIAKGVVVVQVTCTLGERSVSSLGEAHPRNNKNAYPSAMAQKRAFDRAVTELTNSGMYTESDMTLLSDGTMGFVPSTSFQEDKKAKEEQESKVKRIAQAQIENEELENDNKS
jgi:hypothetical protein